MSYGEEGMLALAQLITIFVRGSRSYPNLSRLTCPARSSPSESHQARLPVRKEFSGSLYR